MLNKLPNGYRVEWEPDIITLLRPDGSVVARFYTWSAEPGEILRTALEDARKDKESREDDAAG